MKHDYARQVGPRAQRAASVLFARWLNLARADFGESDLADNILPLALFQPGDPAQIDRLHSLLRKLPEMAHYYLRQHVFPGENLYHLEISSSRLFCL